MNFARIISTLVVVFALMVSSEAATTWLDLFLNSIPQSDPYYGGNTGYGGNAGYAGYGSYGGNTGYRQPKSSGKERYKQLCRVLNPDNYAFPGKVPYPSAPLCPY